MEKIELLAPAGNYDAFLAAANNGADAIYIGGKDFGARSYANNFTNSEIQELINYAHIRDVKVYVVLNTIVFDNEWPKLKSFLDFLYTSDVDALIVQDLGVMMYINENYPSFTIHASTQMNIHTTMQAKAIKSLGVKRVILAREVNLSLASEIKEECGLEIEVFGHGALCVCYSGNCLMSSFIGKRSGNRGRCAQPCRLPYRINDNIKEHYYLSTKDLFTLDKIDMIIAAGVDSIKLEGRMKRPEYVAQVVRSYRKAIDAYYNHLDFSLACETKALQEAFNREFTKGYLFSEKNEELTNIISPNHQGVKIGQVHKNSKGTIDIKLDEALNLNDSIRIIGHNTFGFTISKMLVSNKETSIAKAGQIVRLFNDNKASRGDLVYRTKSAKQFDLLFDSISLNYKKIFINGSIFLKMNYLVLSISDKTHTISVKSNLKVQQATSKNITNARVVEQINKTHDTPYIFTEIKINLPFTIFLPIKEINDLRRRALDELSKKRGKWHFNKEKPQKDKKKINYHQEGNFFLKAKVRTKAQLDKVIEVGYKHIYLSDYNLLKEYEKKYPEIVFYHYMERINPTYYYNAQHKVISDIGSIAFFKGRISSIYLNIVNSYAVYYLITKGVQTVGLSPEISKNQIKELIQKFQMRYNFIPNLELNCYGYQEAMLLQHDFLQKAGITKEDNYLIDRKGFTFPILKEEHYLKILNSQRIHLIDYLDEIKELGITSAYLDFTIEDLSEVELIARMYLDNVNKPLKTSQTNASFGHFRDGVL